MPTFIRLTDYRSSDAKEEGFFKPENRYEANQDDFGKIPGSPIAYWVSDKVREIFLKSTELGELSIPKQGMATSDNNRFLKFWNEVSFKNIGFNFANRDEALDSGLKWFPYNKGGGFRKWYGNQVYVVNWENDGYEIREFRKYKNSVLASEMRVAGLNDIFKESISWSFIGSSNFGVRYGEQGSLFDVGGSSIFPEKEQIKFLIAFLCSKVTYILLKIIAPTTNFQAGNLKLLPLVFPHETQKEQINHLTQQNIDISKQEWDSRETSWDFTKNELLKHKTDVKIETSYFNFCNYWSEKFCALHRNEEELNRLFIDIYDLGDELDEYVDFSNITILKNEAKAVDILVPPYTIDESEEGSKTPEGYMYYQGAKLEFQADETIKQFISYAVGCMFGRYSLDEDGLVVANMNQEIPTDTTYKIDDDNIIPIVDESDYFSDDITDRFIEFVRTTFGSEKLQQNIAFIEKAIGKKIRDYFMKEFYKDHVSTKRYEKRPIFWLFSSPKGTFQVLIYIHRYTPDTLNHILNDYLRPFRIRLDTMKNEAMRTTEREDVSAKEKTDADKKIDKIDKTLDDINEYEKVLAHYAAQRIEIDLDDGVKVNYCKFKELLFEFDKKLCK